MIYISQNTCYIGSFSRSFPYEQKFYYNFLGFLLTHAIMAFMTSFTIINLKDRTSGLDEIFFPSLTVCNINPLKKSFIYWLQDELNETGMESGQPDVPFEDLLNIIGKGSIGIRNGGGKSWFWTPS